MRAAHGFVTIASTALVLAACGGASSTARLAPANQAQTSPPDAGVAAPVGDAGPTSTTVETLGGAAAGGGTRLTPLAPAAGGADAGRPKRQAELGRSDVEIRAVIESHRSEARACYDAGLAAHPGIEGKLDVRWTIDPAGLVSSAEIDTSRSDILEPSVGDCVVAVVRRIHFNASPKGFETVSHFPFDFHPHSRRPAVREGDH